MEHYQGHRHGPELVVHRQQIEAELGEAHKVAAPGEQEREDAGRDEPPLLFPAAEQTAQQKEEKAQGSDVHRSRGERLRSPIGRHSLQHLVQLPSFVAVFLKFARTCGILAQFTGRGPSVVIRDDKVRGLLYAVRPGRRIIQFQSFGARAAVFPAQFRAAAHRIFRIVPGRQQLVRVRRYACAAYHQQQGRCGEKASQPPASLPLAEQVYEFSGRIYEYGCGEVPGNLRVVRFDLEAQRESEEHGSQRDVRQPVAQLSLLFCRSVGIYQGRQHPREKGDCLHLGVVSHLYYLHVVGAERHCDGTGHGHRLPASGREQQEQRAQQGYENIRCRPASQQQEPVERIGQVAVEIVIHRNARHSAEHRIGPERRVVRIRLVVFHDLVCHSGPSGYVGLVHNLAFQHRVHVSIGKCQKKQHYPCPGEDFLDSIVHFHSLSCLKWFCLPPSVRWNPEGRPSRGSDGVC